ncbi:MAG: FtsW/RodA/SpoVE family cell cycle protein [Cyclobacteriaceae bacterium]|nr:FtsW/RodA/SpoVE family cell cycle protein [Cyclobacteriaceae bacterium]
MDKVKEWLNNNIKGDPVIWAIAIILGVISLFVVYSSTRALAYRNMESTEYYLLKHTLLIALSLFAMWVAHNIDYRFYSTLAKAGMILSVPLLIYTWVAGTSLNEASRWITIPVINQVFQPSDLAKLSLIAGIAAMLAKRQQNIEDFKTTLIPMLVWSGIICGLIAMADLSTAIMLFATVMLIMFIGRVPLKYLGLLVLVGAMAGSLAFVVGQRGATAKSRVEAFFNDDRLPYQAEQARIAIASGGITGKGPGKSAQKDFLPHPYSDFVYAIIIEEYGMIGGAIIILLYLALLFRGMKAVANSERAFGGLLSAGLSFALVIQAMVNMGVVVGLGPITGLPLPFLSMGGTSLLFTGMSLGIILSVSRGEVDTSIAPAKGQFKNVAKLKTET